MDSAKASGNQLLKLISQRIDQRRRQEQSEEAAAAPEVFEVPSTLEPVEVSKFASPSTTELAAEAENAADLLVAADPVSTLEAAPAPEVDSDQIPAFVHELAPAPEPILEAEAVPVAKVSPTAGSVRQESPSQYVAEADFEPTYDFPDISKEYQFLDDISVPLEMDKIAEKFVSDAELQGFLHPSSVQTESETASSESPVNKAAPISLHCANADASESRALRLPPPDFAEYEFGLSQKSRESEPTFLAPESNAHFADNSDFDAFDDTASDELETHEQQEDERVFPISKPKDYHGEISTDERHFLLWQYVGGEVHGDERNELHLHILNCKDCASYVWKLTKDSISQPMSLDDPLPKPSVPLPSRDVSFNPDEWLEADHGADRAAYVWKLAAEAAEPVGSVQTDETDSTDRTDTGERARMSLRSLQALTPRKKALIAVAIALAVIVCVAIVPATRGKSDSADLRAQLKMLEAKSEALRKEVEAGRAERDQLLQVQKETELVRQRYENAQGAFQKMSGAVADPTPKNQADSFSKPYPVAFTAPPPDNREIEAVLNDGNGQITMDTNGDIVGLPPLQGDLRQAVRAIIKDHRVDTPGVPANLVSEPGTVSSANGAARDGVMLVSPVGTMVEWTKPTLSWMPVGGAVSYKVQVRNATGLVVAQGEASAGTEWTVPEALPAGNTFSWSITPLQANGSALFPNIHPPAARFGILSKEKQEEIERIRSRYSDSNLVVGLACMKYKLFDNAAKEFKTLLESNPGSALAKKLASAPARRFGG